MEQILQSDTIAAIATGASQAGIGIIRISGPDAVQAAARLFTDAKGRACLADYAPNTIHFGYVRDPDSGEIMDEVMVSVMHAPHSYTAEDTVEINAHGGIYVMRRILALVLAQGVRMAAPGEFTRRAFLNGRLDLARAEAVMDLISSQNEFARRASIAQLEGAVSEKIRDIRGRILHELAFIESVLDDPENYSLDGYPAALGAVVRSCGDEIRRLIERSREGRILAGGVRTAIVGRPNAGKSSLLNALSGAERAIVTEIEGTTRDTVRERVRVGDIVLELIDTAGIRETSDRVEMLGIRRSVEAIREADLVLFLLDMSRPVSDEDRLIARHIAEEMPEDARVLVLLNKSDLPAVTDASSPDVREILGMMPCGAARDAADRVPAAGGAPEKTASGGSLDRLPECLVISASDGTGLAALGEKIRALFYAGEVSEKDEVVITSDRHRECLAAAAGSLDLVLEGIEKNISEDLYAIDLMNAYASLGLIIGEQVEDDLVEEIFSRFCLGK